MAVRDHARSNDTKNRSKSPMSSMVMACWLSQITTPDLRGLTSVITLYGTGIKRSILSMLRGVIHVGSRSNFHDSAVLLASCWYAHALSLKPPESRRSCHHFVALSTVHAMSAAVNNRCRH